MERYKDIALQAVERLKRAGADKAECFLSLQEIEEVSYEYGKFTLMRTYNEPAIRLKAIQDGRTGVVQIKSLEKDAVQDAVASCMAAVKASEQDPFEDIAPRMESVVASAGVFTPDLPRLIDRLVQFREDAAREFPRVAVEMVGTYVRWRRVYANSNGICHEYDSGSYQIYTGFTGREGENSTNFGCGSRCTLHTLDQRIIDLCDVRTQMQRAVDQLYPQRRNEKFVGPVVFTESMSAYCLGTLLNINNGSDLISGIARWKDAIGTEVVDPRITLNSSVSDSRILTACPFTADGYPSADCTLIENGILKMLPLNRYTAAKTGLRRANNDLGGNILQAGDQSFEELIAGIEKGLLVGRVSGTYPDFSGELAGVAKNSFFIENGRIVHPVTETMISGNLFDMFRRVRGISKTQVADGSSVFPCVAVDGVTIVMK